jgi:hypothetical protein
VRDIEHLGSAYDDEQLEVFKAAARQRIADGQAELDLGLDLAAATASGGALVTSGSGVAPEKVGPAGCLE